MKMQIRLRMNWLLGGLDRNVLFNRKERKVFSQSPQRLIVAYKVYSRMQSSQSWFNTKLCELCIFIKRF